jgi:hypothetical protein
MMSVRRVRDSVRTRLSAIFLVYAGNNGGGPLPIAGRVQG